MSEPQAVLVIAQHEANLRVTDDEGRVLLLLQPDGVAVKVQQAGSSVLQRTTKWHDRALVTEVKLSNGARVTQTYVTADEGLRLVITTKVEGGRSVNPLAFKWVYDQTLQ